MEKAISADIESVIREPLISRSQPQCTARLPCHSAKNLEFNFSDAPTWLIEKKQSRSG